MLRNFAYGALALAGGAITGIVISSWATPLSPQQVANEVGRVASVAQPALTMASTSSRAANDASICSPWEVSDVAMEAALREMVRRGWRPPSQAEVVAAFDSYGNPTVQSLEPESPVPVRRPAAVPASSEDETEEPFPVDEVPPPAIADVPTVGPPPVVIEAPTAPSN